MESLIQPQRNRKYMTVKKKRISIDEPYITGTLVRMCAHNQGCVTPPAKKWQTEPEQKKLFFFSRKAVPRCAGGSKRMISALKCAFMCAVCTVHHAHTPENCEKINRSQCSFCEIFKDIKDKSETFKDIHSAAAV